VGKRGLGYDVLVRSHQLPQAIRLAKRLPEPPLVLDRAGQPPSAAGTDRQGTAVADAGPASPGSLQGAGLVTEADHEKWAVDDIRPVRDVLLSAFGPDWLMFGSDWPVCVLAGGGWNRWAAAVEELLDSCSASRAPPRPTERK
jgi:predicted TIM-barrel fold metal-dependent hydrolase